MQAELTLVPQQQDPASLAGKEGREGPLAFLLADLRQYGAFFKGSLHPGHALVGHIPPTHTHTQGSSACPTLPTEISLPIPIWLRLGFIPLPTCQIIASAGCVLKGHSRACSSYQIVLLGDRGGQGTGRYPERGHLAIAPTSTISPHSKIILIQEMLRPRYDTRDAQPSLHHLSHFPDGETEADREQATSLPQHPLYTREEPGPWRLLGSTGRATSQPIT